MEYPEFLPPANAEELVNIAEETWTGSPPATLSGCACGRSSARGTVAPSTWAQ
jgi:hypothetical protein